MVRFALGSFFADDDGDVVLQLAIAQANQVYQRFRRPGKRAPSCYVQELFQRRKAKQSIAGDQQPAAVHFDRPKGARLRRATAEKRLALLMFSQVQTPVLIANKPCLGIAHRCAADPAIRNLSNNESCLTAVLGLCQLLIGGSESIDPVARISLRCLRELHRAIACELRSLGAAPDPACAIGHDEHNAIVELLDCKPILPTEQREHQSGGGELPHDLRDLSRR